MIVTDRCQSASQNESLQGGCNCDLSARQDSDNPTSCQGEKRHKFPDLFWAWQSADCPVRSQFTEKATLSTIPHEMSKKLRVLATSPAGSQLRICPVLAQRVVGVGPVGVLAATRLSCLQLRLVIILLPKQSALACETMGRAVVLPRVSRLPATLQSRSAPRHQPRSSTKVTASKYRWHVVAVAGVVGSRR